MHLFSSKRIKIIVSVIIMIAVVAASIYSGWYAYWSRRHKVLYKVETVYMTQVDDGYEYKIVASAKNWITDNNTYNYFLEPKIGGMPEYSWSGGSDYITVSNDSSTEFEINGFLETKSTDERIVKDEMLSTRYAPCIGTKEEYKFDDTFESASLYMQDYEDAEFIFN